MSDPHRYDFKEFARIWSGVEQDNIPVHSDGINSPSPILKDFFDVTRIRRDKSNNRDAVGVADALKHIDDQVRINYLQAEKWLYEETKPTFLSHLDKIVKHDLFFGGPAEPEQIKVDLDKRAKSTQKPLAENLEAEVSPDIAYKKERRGDNEATYKVKTVIDYSEPVTINRPKFEQAMSDIDFTTVEELTERLGKKEANYWIKRGISLSRIV